MCEVVKVKAGEIFPVIQDILDIGNKVWITVTGMSMYPFLREEKDCVQLAKVNFKAVKRGDIVLVRRVTGEYVLHRVQRKEDNTFFMIGDAQGWIEGPIFPEQLLARVDSVRRNGHNISCDQPVLKHLTLVWLKIIPIRHHIFRLIKFFGNVKKMIKNSRCKSENT